jgi:hypothetical protein
LESTRPFQLKTQAFAEYVKKLGHPFVEVRNEYHSRKEVSAEALRDRFGSFVGWSVKDRFTGAKFLA